MSNNLYHDENGVSSLSGEVANKIREYENIVVRIQQLVNTINSSSDWNDLDVKSAFITKCNEYIANYQGYIAALNNYVNGYLNSKSREIANIERAFS